MNTPYSILAITLIITVITILIRSRYTGVRKTVEKRLTHEGKIVYQLQTFTEVKGRLIRSTFYPEIYSLAAVNEIFETEKQLLANYLKEQKAIKDANENRHP